MHTYKRLFCVCQSEKKGEIFSALLIIDFCDFVVRTTVSRRILKDHYQGELEEDEMPDHQTGFDNEDMMSENSFESEDYAEPVSSATTLPPRHVVPQDDASNYDHSTNYRTTDRPFGDQQAKRGGFFGNLYSM